MLVKIISISLVTVVVSAIIKQYRPDLSLLINICGGILIILCSADGFFDILDGMITLTDSSSISQDIVKPIIKVIGVGYITEFCADIAEDAGNKTISSKILFGGKIAICAVALPIIANMLTAILSLI